MPGHLRAGPAFDDILEKGSAIERQIVDATAMMEIACRDRLYDLRKSEDSELQALLHAAADRAMEAWVGAFVVALERFETEHQDIQLKPAATQR